MLVEMTKAVRRGIIAISGLISLTILASQGVDVSSFISIYIIAVGGPVAVEALVNVGSKDND